MYLQLINLFTYFLKKKLNVSSELIFHHFSFAKRLRKILRLLQIFHLREQDHTLLKNIKQTHTHILVC